MTTDGSTTLSALIRAGALLRPQSYLEYFSKESNTVCSCALGAAYEAAGGTPQIRDDSNNFTSIHKAAIADTIAAVVGYDITEVLVKLPVRDDFYTTDTLSIADAIVYLNDEVDWSRERIADWLKSLGR